MRLAPEGVPLIVAGFTILGAAGLLGFIGGGWWLLVPGLWLPVAVWVPWFFRDPQRAGQRGRSLIVAPADGKVVAIQEVDEDSHIGGRARQISVFMNVFNVHVNRHPVSGTVAYRDYRPGTFLNATLDKASEQNEQMSIGVTSANGSILVRQIAGLVARRIVTDAELGDPVEQGDRLGLIRFGSRVDTIMPLNTELRVRLGDHTKAGVTVLAEWAG